MQAKAFDPKTQRLSYASGNPKPYTLPKLTELQLAALACVRDDAVRPAIEYIGWRKLQKHFALPRGIPARLSRKNSRGFDVTRQVQSLRKRRLIKFCGYASNGLPVYELAPAGVEALAEHPEF